MLLADAMVISGRLMDSNSLLAARSGAMSCRNFPLRD